MIHPAGQCVGGGQHWFISLLYPSSRIFKAKESIFNQCCREMAEHMCLNFNLAQQRPESGVVLHSQRLNYHPRELRYTTSRPRVSSTALFHTWANSAEPLLPAVSLVCRVLQKVRLVSVPCKIKNYYMQQRTETVSIRITSLRCYSQALVITTYSIANFIRNDASFMMLSWYKR